MKIKTVKYKRELTINGKKYSIVKSKKQDLGFIFNLLRKTLLPLVEKYYNVNYKNAKKGLEEDIGKIMILKSKSRRIGYLQLNPKETKLEIKRIFLSPAYSGKGIGSGLLNHFEEIAKNMGYKNTYLSV